MGTVVLCGTMTVAVLSSGVQEGVQNAGSSIFPPVDLSQLLPDIWGMIPPADIFDIFFCFFWRIFSKLLLFLPVTLLFFHYQFCRTNTKIRFSVPPDPLLLLRNKSLLKLFFPEKSYILEQFQFFPETWTWNFSFLPLSHRLEKQEIFH